MTIFSNQVNGHAVGGEHVTSNVDYFTITTGVDIVNNVTAAGSLDSLDASYGAPAGDASGTAGNLQGALDKLVEIISQRGQPVIMAAPSGVVPSCVLKFMTEHRGSWNVTGTVAGTNGPAGGTGDNSVGDLTNAIVAAGIDFGFTSGNTTVTISTTL
jgi:hypothetical protein